ncbi:peptidoglycan DD-metalloendopeptidase family protein [Rivularia sp. UHCC 0363]|uniref:peptidoglycan DD-metalloendopeptidase family protein n=1 Tax=Rivularia sp. UHCC 0363 TaxID=3110244 RepID=UPI002B1ED213|nr:peptidoglycan DD-metalloendopeptidase family protein [Rivularia sp. UHCC 0363]MEA5593666.1 peptidoglycan DD-metalloendopeptidase family protein [Rivularia sp. UHCC 0363]
MTQRKNGHNHSQSAWQRSLPAQSLCWLSSFGFLSSGFVVAQTSGIDNIVPTANSSRQSEKKATVNTPIIISDAPATESPKPKVEFSERRARLKQKLSAKTDDRKETSNLTTKLKRSRNGSVVIKVKKPASTSPRVVIQNKPTVSLPTASKAPINSAKKTRTILPRTTAVSESKKDYNNALIDPTNYGKKYQAPNSVVITERKSGCQSIASGQGISGNCATPSQSQASRNPAKTTPSWLKESQNATLAAVTPSRSIASKVKKTAPSSAQVSSKEVTQTVLLSKSVNTYRATQTIQRVASATPNIVKNAVRSVAPSSRYVSREATRSSKQDYSSNRFIPQPSSFTPQTRVNQEPIAPSGGMLSAPIAANNMAPRPSAVAYNIPLATSLPKVAYSGSAYGSGYSSNYNSDGLAFPLSVPSAISSIFGWRQHPLTGDRRFHSGIDLAAATGTPVLAAYSGQVEIADWVGGYGLTVVLNHNSAQQSLYGHMSQLFVRPGQWVERGTVIGRVGSTGNSTGPHLHFETRQLTPNGWVATNPGTQLQYALNQFLQSLQTAQVVEGTNN